MRPVAAALLSLLLLLATLPAQAAPSAPDPLTCEGYPEPRTFLEVQSWWAEPGSAEPMHLHAGTCFPLLQNMSGTSTFDVRVMLHRNPGTLFALSFDFYSGYEQYINVPDVTCATDCTYWYAVTVDWSKVPAGWRELRLKPRVRLPACGPSPCDEDPGATQITSSGWPLQVRGGTSGNRSECANTGLTSNCQVQSRGWYEHRGYANVAPYSARQWIPQPTFSGTSVTRRWRIYNNAPNGEDEPLTFAECYIDPDFHNPDWVPNPFWTYSGPFPFNANITAPLSGLAPGVHRWACIAYSDQPNHSTPGELAGVGVVQFTVP